MTIPVVMGEAVSFYIQCNTITHQPIAPLYFNQSVSENSNQSKHKTKNWWFLNSKFNIVNSFSALFFPAY